MGSNRPPSKVHGYDVTILISQDRTQYEGHVRKVFGLQQELEFGDLPNRTPKSANGT